MNYFKQFDWKRYNFSLILVVIILCLISAFAVKLAGGEESGDSFFRAQIFGMIGGIIVVAIVSVIDYHFICKFAAVLYLIGTGLVAATRYTPLGTDNNTKTFRWLRLGGFTFQPSELAKIIMILVLATFYMKMKNKKKIDRFYVLVLAGIITAIPTLFIIKQPDLSSSLVLIFIFAILVFASGMTYKILFPIIAVMIPAIPALIWYVQQPFQGLLNEYQYGRVISFLHPELDNNDLLYQQELAKKAIAAGKLYGKFLEDGGGSGRVYADSDLPVAESDFIWAVIGEEFGFLGSCIVLTLLILVIGKCLSVAHKAQDYLGMMIAVGVGAMFAFQVFANIGVVTSLLPNTGLPLPFLSKGISSMMSGMIAIGLVVNVGIQPAKSSKGGFSMRGNADIDVELDLE